MAVWDISPSVLGPSLGKNVSTQWQFREVKSYL